VIASGAPPAYDGPSGRARPGSRRGRWTTWSRVRAKRRCERRSTVTRSSALKLAPVTFIVTAETFLPSRSSTSRGTPEAHIVAILGGPAPHRRRRQSAAAPARHPLDVPAAGAVHDEVDRIPGPLGTLAIARRRRGLMLRQAMVCSARHTCRRAGRRRRGHPDDLVGHVRVAPVDDRVVLEQVPRTASRRCRRGVQLPVVDLVPDVIALGGAEENRVSNTSGCR